MQTHAIIELEEGQLTVTVGRREGRVTRLLHSLRLPLPDLQRDSLVRVLRSIASEVFEGVPGVHLVLGERRLQHFVNTVPKMPGNELVQFIVREALRLTGMQAASEVLVSTRLLRRVSGQRFVIGSTALARSVYEPIAEAFSQVKIRVLSLQSMESCLALAALPQYGDRIAVLECNAGRARFVLCDGQAPVQVRRFLIGGGGEGNADALAAQLAMELPRTLDWLSETGHAAPSTLLLGMRVGIDDDSAEMIRGDLERIVRPAVAVERSEDQNPPGLGVAMLLARLVAGTAPRSLLLPPEVRLPWSPHQLVAMGTAVTVGLACSWSAVVDGAAFSSARSQLDEVVAKNERLQHGMAVDFGIETLPDGTSPEAVRLQTALCLRRPISLLIGDISAAAGSMIYLAELKFASTERLVVTGVVQGKSRKEALSALADFAKRLRDLPYLQEDGQEEVNEVAGQPNQFRFWVSLAWRNS